MATRLLHLVGRQGCGKTIMGQFIVAGMQARSIRATAEVGETCGYLTNAQLRSKFAAFDVVVVEAQELGPRHANLQAGDEVWSFVRKA